jgi:hypothetical protein
MTTDPATDRARLAEIRRWFAAFAVETPMATDLLRMAEDGIAAREALAAIETWDGFVRQVEIAAYRYHETGCSYGQALARVEALCDEAEDPRWDHGEPRNMRSDEVRRALAGGESDTVSDWFTQSWQDAADRDTGGESCHAHRDGECLWERCPQIRDGEPKASGRHCPLDDRTGGES